MSPLTEYRFGINGLNKSFVDVHGLRGVDLRVARHSIYGFLGTNGDGKTTLMKTLLSLNCPTSGRATIFGHDIATDNVAIRERVG